MFVYFLDCRIHAFALVSAGEPNFAFEIVKNFGWYRTFEFFRLHITCSEIISMVLVTKPELLALLILIIKPELLAP